MSDQYGGHSLPRAPLVGAAVLIGIAIAAAAGVRFTGVGAPRNTDAATLVERSLRFEDASDGGIRVLDAAGARVIHTIEPGSNGFVRGTLRGLARERKRQGIGAEAPFQLIARADGRLTLQDPATGRRVDLESFGPVNAAAFAQMLAADGARR